MTPSDVILGDDADLFRVVYRSRSALDGTVPEIRAAADAILATSRRRNAEAGVTGALMCLGAVFIQALEGPAAAVEATFDRICCDLRHTGVEIVECGPILERGFGDWSMSHLVPPARAGTVRADPEGPSLDADALEEGAMDEDAMDECALADTAAAAVRLMASLIKPLPRAPAEPLAA